MKDCAKEVGCTPAQLSLAWQLAKPEVTAAIIGARKREQLDDNLGATGITVPPEIVCWGHHPSQLQQCGALGHRVLSVPTSRRMIQAVPSAMPAMVVRSTPAMRESGVRAAKRGALVCLGRRGFGGKGWPALVSRKVSRWAVICGSH